MLSFDAVAPSGTRGKAEASPLLLFSTLGSFAYDTFSSSCCISSFFSLLVSISLEPLALLFLDFTLTLLVFVFLSACLVVLL